jgi:hypothetical protein
VGGGVGGSGSSASNSGDGGGGGSGGKLEASYILGGLVILGLAVLLGQQVSSKM